MTSKQIPVTMLSGFLGAGKTTLLRHLLSNSKLKIGCIVNDVANVNIDAKLIRNNKNKDRDPSKNTTKDLADTIELANGCACCNIQDELFDSFDQLLDLADRKGTSYDRFVLENSGVAEPQNIRDKFADAVATGHPAVSRIYLDTMVTIVDSGTFVVDFASKAPMAARADLGEGGNLRPVVDLLVEQIECADFVLLNKIDQLEGGKVDELSQIMRSLNPLAQVSACEHGVVDIEAIFGKETQGVYSTLNIEGQHRSAVAAAKQAEAASKAKHGHDDHGSHEHHHHAHGDEAHAHKKHDHKEHDHEHDHAHKGHDHEHGGKGAEGCGICRDDKHAGHSHDHGHEGHDHSHHNHSHGHGHGQETSAAERFGIRSFVYSRRRPFHSQRLKQTVLKWLPVTTNHAIDGESPETGASPIKTVLRSKGFMWMSHSHGTAFYWSHAGAHFNIADEGDWWAAVPDDDWPEDEAQRGVILADFATNTRYGDRRQEIVFIGAGMDEAAISKQLDQALLTDAEMGEYDARYKHIPDPVHPGINAT